MQGIAPMSNENEGEENGVPFGLLMYGQAGVYNAVDDRVIITALSDSAVGVVRPALLTAGAGLTVNVSPGWMAIASCDDGTSAVVGARQSHQLQAPAGIVNVERWYHLWVDTNPDAARWELRIILQEDTIGRPGVSLARITVPAGANLASQMRFSRMVPTIGRHADCWMPGGQPTATRGLTRITPEYVIAPYQMQGNRAFRLWAYGGGRVGTARTLIQFRGAGGVGSQPTQSVDLADWLFANEPFNWEANLLYHVRADAAGMRSSLTVTISRQADRQQGRTRTFTRYEPAHGYNQLWQTMFLEAGWSSVIAGQQILAGGSTFETFEPYNL